MSQHGSANASMDALVDQIAERVRARLSGVAPSSPPGQRQRPEDCGQSGQKSCDTCRGCHVFRPDDVRGIIRLGASRVAAGVGHARPAGDLAGFIDHTLLKPDATRDELKALCEEARRYQFATVCVNAANVRYCKSLLEGSPVKTIAVVGFPLGACTPNAKAFETREAVRNGAEEIDTVINVGALKSGDYATVLEDIRAVVAAAAPKPVKVILETALLNEEQKIIACALSKVAEAAFVKTSTGFGPGGATVDDIRLMRRIVGEEMGVKASGGVRDEATARAMIDAGATRLGASASVEIVSGPSKTTTLKKRAAGGY